MKALIGIPFFLGSIFLFIGLIMVVVYFALAASERKQKAAAAVLAQQRAGMGGQMRHLTISAQVGIFHPELAYVA